MPAQINIWNDSNMAANGAQTGGTWTYTGNITPAPTPPVTYNGTADFTGITTAGNYEFTYTVTGTGDTDESVHIVNFTSSLARVGDTCATPYFLPSTPSAPFVIEIEDYNEGRCPGLTAPTDSGTAIPAQWTNTPYSGDIWYYVYLPTKTQSYIFFVTINGTPYNVNGIDNPAIQIYTNTPGGGGCGSMTLKNSAAATGSQSVLLSIQVPVNTQYDCWIRVASPVGDEGTFLARFEAICV